MSNSMTRRQFVHRSAAAAAAIGLPMFLGSRAFGANEEIRVAMVGCGVRFNAHLDGFGPQPGVRLAFVCDPDRVRMADAAKSREQVRIRSPASRRRAATHGEKRFRRPRGFHDAVLARAADDLGLPDRPPRLCRKAAGAFDLGRPPDGQRGAEIQPPRASGNAMPLGRKRSANHRLYQVGRVGKNSVRGLLRQQGASAHRQAIGAAADSRDARLRVVVRPGAKRADLPRPHPIRLQLHVGQRRRRIVQPGRA